MDITGFSIIIATKGRVALLENLLVSVRAAQSAYGGASEILLVDDSDRADGDKIESIAAACGARVLKHSPSVAGKRNCGAKNARFSHLLFLDSDCVAQPGLLTEHHKKYTDDAVSGVFGLLTFTGGENRFWKSVSKSPYVICFSMPLWGPESPWATTANFSVRRDRFFEVNGFDETFPNRPGGEDVDLGLRLTAGDNVIRNAPDAVVVHDKSTWSSRKAMYSRVWHYGRADAHLVKRHPQNACPAPPGNLLLCALIAAALAVISAFTSPLSLLLLPCYFTVQSLFYCLLAARLGPGKKSFAEQAEINILNAINELGYVSMCLKLKKPSFIFRQTVFFDNQINGVMRGGNMLLASHGAALALLAAYLQIGAIR
jgi:glycosyltransferase involved in cell wall biosynthesis